MLRCIVGILCCREEMCNAYTFNVSTNQSDGTLVYNTTQACKWDYDGKGLLYQVRIGSIYNERTSS